MSARPPSGTTQDAIAAAHLHINTADLFLEMNIALPIHRLNELAGSGVVGRVGPEHFSVMGYQEEGAEVWRDETAPEIIARCHAGPLAGRQQPPPRRRRPSRRRLPEGVLIENPTEEQVAA